MMPSVGSMTSPAPLTIRLVVLSATASIASSRRRTRSCAPLLGQLDDGAAVFVGEFAELLLEAFEQGEGVGGGAGEAGEDLPPPMRRILMASCLATTLPSVTWPSRRGRSGCRGGR